MYQSFDLARNNMVEGQLRPNNIITPALIDALRRTPRERFVPRHLQGIAYVDEDIALGNGRFLAEPMVIARLLQAAEVQPSDIALDIGCGTGYSSALLGAMAATVVGIEQDKNLAQEADKLLHDLDVHNAAVVQQPDLREGYPQQGPYNVILINGSVAAVPDNIRQQLAEGGRLVTVLSRKGHMGSAILMTRSGDGFATRKLFDAATPILAGFGVAETFVF